MDQEIRDRFDSLEKHMDVRFDMINQRFDEVHRVLLQMQSDLLIFSRELGRHDARLDNLEGK